MRTSARATPPKTATIYTDLGIMTCNEEITTDIAEAFNLVTGIPHFKSMRHLLMAPFNMLERFLEMIDREIAHAQAGKPAGITAKMNALVEKDIIDALYRASEAGVPVRLLVRGICVLRPGVPGLSENIEVRSLVAASSSTAASTASRMAASRRSISAARTGCRAISATVWNSSATPHARAPRARERAARDLLEGQPVRARTMLPDGKYRRLETGEPPFDAQEFFIGEVDPKYQRATQAR